ncbi:MAG: DUF2695 domain-containing protein [Propionicimonas sp.]
METSDLVLSLEAELRLAARLLILPAAGECLACYVARMLGEFGCTGSRWVLHYRDLRTPRATALVRRLQDMGVYCDCQMFQNAYRPTLDLDSVAGIGELPPCLGVRAGSTRPCTNWQRIRRGW